MSSHLLANATNHDDDDAVSLAWIFVPLLLGSLLYMALVLCTWPYARAAVPVWLLLFCILLPPFFPFVLFYLLCFAAAVTPPVVARPVVIAVDGASTRGPVRATVFNGNSVA